MNDNLLTIQLRAGDLWVDDEGVVGVITAVTLDGPFDTLTVATRRQVIDVPVPVATGRWRREDGAVTRLA
jgi:hypothetical protein